MQIRYRTRSAPPFIAAIFLVIGLGLFVGASAAYYYVVERPRAWPKARAVVSSRVVNPSGPSRYQPEIVFRIEDGASARQITTIPSWNSSSYGIGPLVRRTLSRRHCRGGGRQPGRRRRRAP